MCENSMRENREIPEAPSQGGEGRLVKACGRTTGMYATGKSDGRIVPAKRANKTICDGRGGVGGGKACGQGEVTSAWDMSNAESSATGTNTHTRRLRFTDACSRRFCPTRSGTAASLLCGRSVSYEAAPNCDNRHSPKKSRRGSSKRFSAVAPRRRARKSENAPRVTPRRLRRSRQGYQFWDFENYLAETGDQNEIQAVYTNEPQPHGNLVSQYRKDGAIWTPSYYQYDVVTS